MSADQILLGDCLERLKELDDNSVDSVCTDPPYGLSKEPSISEVMQHWINGDKYEHNSKGFMGKSWDSFVPGPEYWREVYRVLKPGAHVAVFAGTRTWDLMSCALRFAGFQNRDTIASFGGPPGLAWTFGSGFPKSSRINRSDAFCQCALDKHSISNTNQGPRAFDHTDNPDVLADDGLPPLSAQRLTNKVVNSPGDCRLAYDLSDEQSHPLSTVDQVFSPSQEYAQERNHSVERDDARNFESSRNPCPAQRIDRPSSPDCSVHSELVEGEQSDIPLSKEELASNPIQTDSETLTFHKSHRVSKSLACKTVSDLLEKCQACGKPIANGLGTALKPAWEIILLFRKPFDGPAYQNVLRWGVGGLNIDASRIGTEALTYESRLTNNKNLNDDGWDKIGNKGPHASVTGRWPANLLLDEDAAAMLDEQSGERGNNHRPNRAEHKADNAGMFGLKHDGRAPNDSGGASRFFYCAKSSKSERNFGLEGMVEKQSPTNMCSGSVQKAGEGSRLAVKPLAKNQNHHPTVKPIKLMEYLIRLITPPGGTCLDPFAGSGSTLVAAKRLGFKFIGIEMDAQYVEIAKRRVDAA